MKHIFVYKQTYGYLFAKNIDRIDDRWISQEVLDLSSFRGIDQSMLMLTNVDNQTIIDDVKQLFDIDIKLPEQSNTLVTSLIINELSNPTHKSMLRLGWQYAILGGFIPTVYKNEKMDEHLRSLVKIIKVK